VQSLAEIGARVNGYTEPQYMRYCTSCRKKHLKEAFSILDNMLSQSKINDVEKERKIITEEIAYWNDDASKVLDDAIMALVYPGQEIGKSRLGTVESVASITRDDLQRYRQENYVSSNIAIGLSGDFTINEAEDLLEASAIPPGEVVHTEEKAALDQGVLARKSSASQVSFELVYRGIPALDERREALHLLTLILGRGMWSRVWDVVRTKHGLAYTLGGWAEYFRNSGFIRMGAEVAPENACKAALLIRDEIEKICQEEVSEREFLLAREMAIADTIIVNDYADGRAWSLAESIALDYPAKTTQEEVKKIEAVTKEDILSVAQEVFSGKIGIAATGSDPEKLEEELDGII
jgi:predicted Zn-dependent peptidase